MLKLTYTLDNFSLEHLNESLENWVNVRVILAVRLATSIHIEPSTASFLLPAEFSGLIEMENATQENRLQICRCDNEFIEVVLKGLWLTSDVERETGVFVTELLPSTELLLQQLSQFSVTGYQSSVIS